MWFIWALCCSSLIRLAQGMCGFPGYPKTGTVLISVNETHQNAFYSCPNPMLIDGNVNRTCIDGKWAGSLPRCGVQLKLLHASNANRARSCQLISNSNLTIPFNLTLYVEHVALDAVEQSKDEAGAPEITLHSSTSNVSRRLDSCVHASAIGSSLISICDFHENGHEVHLFGHGLCLNSITVHAFPDGCGKPEEPANGHVVWDEHEATYHCDDGFELSTESSTRTCIASRWTEEQPTCSPMNSSLDPGTIIFGRPFKFGALFGIAVALVIFAIGYLVYRCKTNIRLLCLPATRNEPIYDDAVEADHCSTNQPKVENAYEEIRERIEVLRTTNVAMSELNSSQRQVVDGFQGYEIPNHLL